MNFQKYYGKQKVYTYIIKMTSTIDFNTLPENAPSMCIPRVFKNVTRERIVAVFRDLDLGIIERIDMIGRENENGDKFQRVFIHFKKWFRNENADRARDMLIQGKEIKVIYDDPWFWKISANKSKPSQKRKPQISFDSSPQRPRTHVHVPRSPSNSPPHETQEGTIPTGEIKQPTEPKRGRVILARPVLAIDEN